MVFRRLFFEWIVLLSLSIALAFFAARADIANRLDSSLLDRAAALARPAQSDDIIIVAIDDASLAQVGTWPWPRTVHARLIDELARAGSGPVLFDVLFLEPSTAADDERLAEAIARHGDVILPHTFAPQPNSAAGIVPAFPIENLRRNAAATGHVVITPDPDGVLRRFDLEITANGESYPHFALQAARLNDSGVQMPTGVDPVLSFHPAGTYAQVPAAEVIAGSVPAEFLRGKTIIIGATAQGMGDRYSVGSGSISVMPGVETQANLYDALGRGGLVSDWPPVWSGLLAALALLAQFVVFWKMSPRAGLAATLVIAGLVVAGAVLSVPLTGAWVAPGVALLAVVLAYPIWSWRRLTSVSAYLEEEAAFLRPEGAKRAKVEGFDQIARQVARMRSLVNHVSRSFAFLGKVIEAAPDAILVLDRAGDVVMANAKAMDLFPDWREEHPQSLASLLQVSDAQHDDLRHEILFPDGRTFLAARAEFDLEDDLESGEIMALRDVSDIRRREQERREMLEFLSHDMRTPQVAIIGLSRQSGQGEDAEDISRRIRKQAHRTLKLADDFVQLAMLDEAELDYEDSDCVALAEEACDRAYSAARAKRIVLEPELPEEPVFANVDASLIARLLDNLVGNAIKFAPEGSSVRIGLDDAPPRHFCLWVADAGPGLPTERLANPFARFGAHEQRAGPSVGLGLAFVKRVVDRHDGTITVASRRGKGTRFEIELPLQR
ncbi:CHASE2 domain-containing protein [Erythrobacter alti]|uniref:CHASE2 domain-containing protein n=1 Tax=Erythrobacter alti TaxID=1896145 RepID=UPI0030F4874D